MGFFNKVFGSHNHKSDSGMGHSMESHKQDSAIEDSMKSYHTATISTLARDPICGMDVDIHKAAAKSEYQGQTYYFCAPGCKAEFDKNPVKYLDGKQPDSATNANQGGSCCH